jgi:hypothetical protein
VFLDRRQDDIERAESVGAEITGASIPVNGGAKFWEQNSGAGRNMARKTLYEPDKTEDE